MKERIGFTTTIPVEVIIAAGCKPIDLNNIFITSNNPNHYISEAERKGFPRNICAWIKGLYSIAIEKGIKKIICISEGDCAGAVSMCEVAEMDNIEIIPFSYPMKRDKKKLEQEISFLINRLGTDINKVQKVEKELQPIRNKLKNLDFLTWKDRKINGEENHYWLVSGSDFNGNPDEFESNLSKFIEKAESRKSRDLIPLAYIGVPPIINDLYSYLNELGADVVFNETQRQFAMIGEEEDIIDRYLNYTYPYGIRFRLENDILPEIKRRGIRGVIHYVQSFCHRQVEDIILRRIIKMPILTLECDKPGNLDNRNKIRLEAFMEMF